MTRQPTPQHVTPAEAHSRPKAPPQNTAHPNAGKKPNAKPTAHSCANGEQKTPKRTPRDANEKTPRPARQRKWRQPPYGAIAHKKAYRRWTLRNPEAAGEIRVRRAKAEAEGNATPTLIQAKWEASSRICCLCGESINPDLKSPDPMSPTVEHKVPIARGGRHDIDNIDFAHRVCSSSKGARTTEEYMERRKLAG